MVRSIIAITVLSVIASAIILNAQSKSQQSEYMISDAQLIKSLAELAHRIARNSRKQVNLTISKSGDKGHAAIIRDGTTLWELTTDDCLLAPLNYTVTFDRNGNPTEPATIIVTNGSELYIDISTDGVIELSSAEIAD